ncbi:tetratricopeptide repeat protein [Cysteiniphilum sp. QT6929]|uniref:tetratricopeptide repeat protein n=1 Tax=Cysteiniphilum sp. QT6929 TaxID=2975055 RepID=UPI0024B3BFA4|nr:tetratricopeptide repeat protein [Cysteiniphilum sp. QT6929]WHN65509.1 sel1 repeat family protein [Cysteiniphilum sp. QT6929]
MKLIKNHLSIWVGAIIALLAIILGTTALYHNNAHAIISSKLENTANVSNDKPEKAKDTSDNEPINYTRLSPKAAYDKGVEYSKQISKSGGNNIDKAVDYIQYSAATGYAEAQFKLGLMYFQGLGVQSNPAVGFYWIEKAAKNDYAEAQIYLAYMYKKGIGVSTNLFKSNYWLRQARANGIDLSLDALPFF